MEFRCRCLKKRAEAANSLESQHFSKARPKMLFRSTQLVLHPSQLARVGPGDDGGLTGLLDGGGAHGFGGAAE